MSHLRLFAPEDAGLDGNSRFGEDGPVILHFPVPERTVNRPHFLSLTDRSRLVREHRCCRLCGRAAVETVELLNQTLNGKSRPVPGSASVVGFHCRVCDFEWTA